MIDRLKQFLLSLLNATLMLGIILVLLALFLVYRVETFTTNVVSEVKLGLLEEVDADVRQVVGAIRATDRDLREVADKLDRFVERPEITLSPELRQEIGALDAKLTDLRDGVTRFLSSHDAVSDQAVRDIASRLAESYLALRHCRVQPEPKRDR